MKDVLRKVKTLAMNLVQRVMVDRSGDGAVCQTAGLFGRVVSDVEHLQTQGVHFKAPVGAEGVLVAPDGIADNAVLLNASSRRDLPTETLSDGEGGLHYLGAFKVFVAADGTLALGEKVPSDFVALASLVDARLSSIQATFDAHTHPAPGGTTSPSGTPIGPLASVASTNVRCN